MNLSKYFPITSIPFWLMNLAAIIGPFLVPFDATWLWVGVGLYFLRMFGITGVYHRYFAHRSYKTSRPMQFIFAVLGTLAAQKGPLWWAAHHRVHHKHSGQADDIHAPETRGFWWSHIGWIVSKDYDATNWDIIKDFAKYPELVWLNKYPLIAPILLGVGIFLIGGWTALVWGFLVSTFFCYHCTFFINSLCHMFGRRRFATTDDSRNSLILALLTMGEGWHNNHHFYQHCTRQGIYWWEIDMTYYILKVMSWVGLVWDLKQPPQSVYQTARETVDASFKPVPSQA